MEFTFTICPFLGFSLLLMKVYLRFKEGSFSHFTRKYHMIKMESYVNIQGVWGLRIWKK
jgi:carbohydrate-binding DOMON domain-containing protein